MSNELTPQEIIEINLKTEISRQSGLKEFQFNCKAHTFQHLFKSWKMLEAQPRMKYVVVEMIWDYFLTSREKLYIQVRSDVFGDYSIIADYENAKGKKHKAHFKKNGKYIGPVSKLGEKPIAYDTSYPISKDRFTLNISKLRTAESPAELFEVKRGEDINGEEEEELTLCDGGCGRMLKNEDVITTIFSKEHGDKNYCGECDEKRWRAIEKAEKAKQPKKVKPKLIIMNDFDDEM
jgi:hypothetical protein